jgi:raffinose/stachyose/melibiose transport system substrate-binding protein
MKRFALAAVIGLLAILPVQAQTVVKYLNIASIPAEVELMNQAVKEYEAAHPGVKIELPFLENEAFKAKLTTRR